MVPTLPLSLQGSLRIPRFVLALALVFATSCVTDARSIEPTSETHGRAISIPPSKNLEPTDVFPTRQLTVSQVTHVEIPINTRPRDTNAPPTDRQFFVGEPVGSGETPIVMNGRDIVWQTNNEGLLVGTVKLRIAGAEALRATYRIACQNRCDGYVAIHSDDKTGVRLEVNDKPHWTPLLRGDSVTIQIVLHSEEARQTFQFTAGPFSRVSPQLEELKRTSDIGQAGTCNVDFRCVADPNSRLAPLARSVAKLLFTNSVGATSTCTGTLLNSVPYTGAPYVLTAAHCLGPRGDLAPSLTTFWNFDSASCGFNFTNYTQVSGGSQLVMYDPTLDVALLRMNFPAPTAATFAGISGTPVPTGAEIISLHHPRGDLKKFSRGYGNGYQPGPTSVSGVPSLSAGLDSYLGVVWTTGGTEGGSSGAPALAFRASTQPEFAPGYYEVKGVLSLGSGSCGTRVPIELFGRVDLAMSRLLPFIYPAAIAPNSTTGSPVLIEFFNPQFDYYFMTSRTSEIGTLDTLATSVSGTVAGVTVTRRNILFHRTGQWYRVNAGPTSSRSKDLTRYFIPGAAKNGTRGSHFYTSSDAERNTIRATGTEVSGAACGNMASRWFCNEGIDSNVTSSVGGQCLPGEAPVYRLFRGEPRYRDDGNHRYTGDPDILRYMSSDLGWTDEGVQFCVRP